MNELDDLEKQIAELQARKDTIIADTRKKVLTETIKNIHQYGFTVLELGLGAKPKKSVKGKKLITFRDPATGKEWDGELNQQGRKPDWIAEKIKEGTIEQFRVNE